MPNPRQRRRVSHYAKVIIDRSARKCASQNKSLDKKIKEYEKLIEQSKKLIEQSKKLTEQSKKEKEANDKDLKDEEKAVSDDIAALVAENETLKAALNAAKTCEICNRANEIVFHTHKTCLNNVSTIESTL